MLQSRSRFQPYQSTRLSRYDASREPEGEHEAAGLSQSFRWRRCDAAVYGACQQPRKLPTIGFLGQSTPVAESSRLAAFLERLRELGWIDGQTVAIEYGWAEGVAERFAEIARRFVQIKVDVIVT